MAIDPEGLTVYDRERDLDDILVATDWAMSTALLSGACFGLPRSIHEAVVTEILASVTVPVPDGERDRSLNVCIDYSEHRDRRGAVVWQALVAWSWKVDMGTTEETHVMTREAIGSVGGDAVVEILETSPRPSRRVHSRRYGMSAAEYYELAAGRR